MKKVKNGLLVEILRKEPMRRFRGFRVGVVKDKGNRQTKKRI